MSLANGMWPLAEQPAPKSSVAFRSSVIASATRSKLAIWISTIRLLLKDSNHPLYSITEILRYGSLSRPLRFGKELWQTRGISNTSPFGPPTNRRAAGARRSCRRARGRAAGWGAREGRSRGAARAPQRAGDHVRAPRPSARLRPPRVPRCESARGRSPAPRARDRPGHGPRARRRADRRSLPRGHRSARAGFAG